jgi:hypothetical protein
MAGQEVFVTERKGEGQVVMAPLSQLMIPEASGFCDRVSG